MKQTKLFHGLFPFIMMGIPWIYLGIIWNDLPQTIPTHFGISGDPDQYGAKNEIFIAPAILSVTGILMYFILRNIHKIDPRKKYTATTSAVMAKLAVVIIIFLCAASLFVFYWTLKGKVEGLSILLCGLGLLLAYIGNLMYSIKPNYFAGFRVPWALENEDNWRKTHQLASKIWFIGGIVLAIAALVLNLKILAVVFVSAIMIMTLIPVIYSYNIYRKSSKTK
ncbi:MAG: SdpI family protein [Chitinophagaceae bacterium]|nr:SdpI family protein [Chitinophagaceae bacterium]